MALFLTLPDSHEQMLWSLVEPANFNFVEGNPLEKRLGVLETYAIIIAVKNDLQEVIHALSNKAFHIRIRRMENKARATDLLCSLCPSFVG